VLHKLGRSVRQLSLTQERVRSARADSRRSQIERIRTLHPQGPGAAELAALLVQIERLTEALAEGEIDDLGFGSGPAYAALARLIAGLRGD
jgi:hypothetical protein